MAATRRSILSTARETSDSGTIEDDHAPLLLTVAESYADAYPHAPPSLLRPTAFAGAMGALLLLLLLLANQDDHLAANSSQDDILRQALKLTPVQTQIVHRHGDRTPITPLEDELFWSTLLPTKELLDDIGRHTNIIRLPDAKPHPAGGGAVYGRLTVDGLEMMKELGTQLRSDVVERLMPGHYEMKELENVDPSTWLKVSSTDFSRTIQSVQSLLMGMLPTVPNADIEIDARHTLKMIPDPQPRRYVGQAERERELMNSPDFTAKEETMKSLAVRMTNALFHSGVLGEAALKVSFGVGEDEAAAAAESPKDLGSSNNATQHILPWNQLAEILICLEKRDRLPKDISPQDLKDVAEHNAWRWFALLSDEHLAAMAIKSLAKKMIMNGAEAVDIRPSSAPPPLLHIFSGHDATLISILCFFRIERPSVWPEYGSYLKMELLRDDVGVLKDTLRSSLKAGKARHYILFSLNGEPLRSTFGGIKDIKDGSNSNRSSRFFVPWLNFIQELTVMEKGLPPLAANDHP